MRVNFNSLGLEISGGNRTILELANGLIDRGHKVTITHLGDPSKYQWFPDIKAEIKNIPDTPFSVTDRAIRKYLGKYLKKYQHGQTTDRERKLLNAIPDCDVNVATLCWTAYSTYYSGKGKGYYLVQHFEPLFFEGRPEIQKRAEATYQLPLRKVCVSQWLSDKVGGENIGNGINITKFRDLNLPKKYDVMVVSRGISWKGNYEPVVNGLRREGLSVFEVKANVSEQELVEGYNQSRVFLFLSESEGFGFPPLEAMGCGTPVITTPCLEYANGENVYLLKQKNPETVILEVKQVLKDEKLLESLKSNGAATAKQMDFQNVIKNFLKAIEGEV